MSDKTSDSSSTQTSSNPNQPSTAQPSTTQPQQPATSTPTPDNEADTTVEAPSEEQGAYQPPIPTDEYTEKENEAVAEYNKARSAAQPQNPEQQGTQPPPSSSE